MKIGCCLNMVAEGPDGTGIEQIEKLAQLGYDYVELPTAQMMALDEAAFAAFKERLFRSGVPCETSNNLFPVSMRLTGPDVDMDQITAYAEKAFARDEELGIKICVLSYFKKSRESSSAPKSFIYLKIYKIFN